MERVLFIVPTIESSMKKNVTKAELEKCLNGEWYDCHDEIFLEYMRIARDLSLKYRTLFYNQKEEKRMISKELFGHIGENVSVGTPFICDYGCNIYWGNNVSIHMNCTFVDCNKIEIGNNVCVAVGNPCRVIWEINKDA